MKKTLLFLVAPIALSVMPVFAAAENRSEVDVACSASLGLKDGMDGLFVRIKNVSSQSVFLRADETPWASPKNITVFFSVDGEMQPSPSYWKSALIAYEVPQEVSLEIPPSGQLVEFIPIERYFPAAADHRSKENVYLYWSFSITYYRSDPFKRNELLELPKIMSHSSPRIGGFETLKKIYESR